MRTLTAFSWLRIFTIFGALLKIKSEPAIPPNMKYIYKRRIAQEELGTYSAAASSLLLG
jgi:hypothetical protein